MKIKMSEVRDNKLSSKNLRHVFYHIPNIRELTALRQCIFIGKVVRGLNAHSFKKY